ncbi:MAG TPA: AsmA family protein, partial [Albitalea sp.]|nr:AsmA family protein [Albitalea sp.]
MTPAQRARLRKAAWPVGIVVAAAVAVVWCEAAGWPFLEGPAQRQLSQRLQRPVQFGEHFRLKLFGSIRLDTDALRVGAPQGLPSDSPLGGNLLGARDVHLELPFSTVMNLLRSRHDEPPRITSLRLEAAQASLKRLADGRANWTFGAPHPAAADQPFDMPVVDELVLRQGHVTYDDAVLKSSLDATVSTSEGRTAQGASDAGLAIEGRGKHENQPFEVHVHSAGVLPLVARDHAARVPITIRLIAGDSRFSFDGTGTDVLSFEAIDGAATLSGPSLAKVGDKLGVTLPTTEPFTLKARLTKSGPLWSLKNADLAVGDSRLAGEFSYDRSAKVPMLTGELGGPRLVLADLLPAFGAARPGTGNPKPPPGHLLPQREFDIPSLHRMNARVKLRLQRAELGTLFREPLAPLQGDLSLDGGVLAIDKLLARAAGGELKGSMSVDPNNAVPQWRADMRWAGIDLDQWLRPRNRTSQVAKPSGENPGYVTGKLGGHAQLRARGRSAAQVVGSADGTVQMWVRDGTVSHLAVEAAGIDVAQALGVYLIGDNPLPMQCAVVKADAKGGKLTPEVAIVDTKDSTLLVSG